MQTHIQLLWTKKQWHFTWPLRVLTSGISQLRKNARIVRSPGFWHFSPICKIPLVSTITGREKCCYFCCLGALTEICTSTDQKSWDTLLATLEYLKVEFRKSEKRSRILRSSGFCHFFNEKSARIFGSSGFRNFYQIWNIPFVSTLTGHVKCRGFFPYWWCVELCVSNQA